MGFFSWKTCDTRRSISNAYSDRGALPCKVLIPLEYQSEFNNQKFIFEDCYEGYGTFGGYDIYDLIAKWNRKFLSENPNHILPYSQKTVSNMKWCPYYADLSLTEEEVVNKVRKNGYSYFEWRSIGIDIACYNEDNVSLRYPIKISEKEEVYEQASASKDCPYQGFFY